MTDPEDDDRDTPLSVPWSLRQRRQSDSQLDSSAVLLEALREVEGVYIPESGAAPMEARALISRFVHKIYEQGLRARQVDLVATQKELAVERQRREACASFVARVKNVALEVARALGDLARHDRVTDPLIKSRLMEYRGRLFTEVTRPETARPPPLAESEGDE